MDPIVTLLPNEVYNTTKNHSEVLLGVVYFIWQESNGGIHNGKERNVYVLTNPIIDMVPLKLLGIKVRNSAQVKLPAELWNLIFGHDLKGQQKTEIYNDEYAFND